MLLAIECILVVIAVCLAIAFPRLGDRWFTFFERHFARLASRRLLSVVVVGLSALALRLALLPVLGIPDPAGHDEFSYLLAADTFAHGRLANPTHPMWTHFETFHINQQPTYVSMYFPAQGVVLALGKVIFGHPIWGVWLSTALMCAAICWMLQAWVTPQWALLGGLLAVVRLGTFSYWMNSYWGGSVAALGGALVLGALPRIKQSHRLKDVLLMGLGSALLANSRPYEGLFLSIPVAVALLFWIFGKDGASFRTKSIRVLTPLALLFLLAVALMAYYFWRTTGSPFHTPYAINSATYRPVGVFPWQAVNSEISYHHQAMHDYYTGWVMDQYRFSRTHPLILLILKAFMTWNFFLGPALTIPFFAACFVLPYGTSFRDFSPGTQFMLLVFSAVMVGVALLSCLDPHYLAPVTCVFYGLLVVAMRCVWGWGPQGRPVGIALVRAVPAVVLASLVLPIFVPRLQTLNTLPELMTWCSPGSEHTFRQGILDKLFNTPGQHLVIVRYTPHHDPRNDWVFNDADIDHSRVVWARDMGRAENQELIRYFGKRKVWVVEPDNFPPAPVPYVEKDGPESNRVQQSGFSSQIGNGGGQP